MGVSFSINVYNSLKRKGKADGFGKEDIAHVVAARDTVNEKTWDDILKRERMFRCDCKKPTLKRFKARPHDLSPSHI